MTGTGGHRQWWTWSDRAIPVVCTWWLSSSHHHYGRRKLIPSHITKAKASATRPCARSHSPIPIVIHPQTVRAWKKTVALPPFEETVYGRARKWPGSRACRQLLARRSSTAEHTSHLLAYEFYRTESDACGPEAVRHNGRSLLQARGEKASHRLGHADT